MDLKPTASEILASLHGRPEYKEIYRPSENCSLPSKPQLPSYYFSTTRNRKHSPQLNNLSWNNFAPCVGFILPIGTTHAKE
jgi:hypothetical protein